MEAVHTLDVDIDVARLKEAVEEAGDTGPVRLCLKQMKQILKTARVVREGVVRHRITYLGVATRRDSRHAQPNLHMKIWAGWPRISATPVQAT